MARGRIKEITEDPDHSIASRIRQAMTNGGIRSVAELGRRLDLPRQTVHRWLNGDTKNMTHTNLYKLADVLQVRARWLVLGDSVTDHVDWADGDIRGLVQVFQTLPASAREQWMAIGRTLQNMPAVANTDAAVEQLMSGAI
jgi:transcriptional regulator with XRE-family HTH domain